MAAYVVGIEAETTVNQLHEKHKTLLSIFTIS